MLTRILYIWRIIGKLLSFGFFGGNCLLLFSVGFPLMHILSGFSERRFKILARKVNFIYFKIFVLFMKLIGCITVSVENKETLKNLKSRVVIANHPSLLDVVILFSQVPNADCIVKGALIQNKFMSRIIRNLYIPNSLSFEEQLEQAKKSMEEGNNLIIFPEGTRSRPGEPWQFKKGAARFALYANVGVTPIYFGGNEKIGLRKFDRMLQFHPTERFHYNLKVLSEISVNEFVDMPMSKSAILLTDKMKSVLEQEHHK